MSSLNKYLTPSVIQSCASLSGLLTKLGGGMVLGFTSCFLTSIREPESHIKMNLSTSSWYVASIGIAANFGFLLAIFTSRYGRRISLIFNSIPAITGQLLTYFASDVTTLMVGRVLTGFTIGSNVVVGIIMIGECASPRNRGMLLNLTTVILNAGCLIMHAVGYYTSWRNLALIISATFGLSSFFAYISPESPSWLAERKQFERSREAFYTLRGRTPETTREIEELIRAQQHNNINKTLTQNIVDFFSKFKKKNFLKPLLIVAVGVILTEASGRHIFPAYAGVILQELKCNMCNAQYTNMVLDVLIIVSGVCASYLIRVMNMRTLLFTSGAATLLVLYCACALIYLLAHRIINEQYSWVAVIMYVMFLVLANLGCACIPFAIIGELFPLEHRIVASCIIKILTSTFVAVSLKLYPLMSAACSTHGAFGVLGVCMSLALVILYFVLPETKNRTLQEIEDYFNYGAFREGDAVPSNDVDLIQKLNKTGEC